MADKETVTLKLPSGESVDFVVPGGMSDAEVKTYVLSKRPDLFQGTSSQAASTGPATSIGPAKSNFSPFDPAYYGEKIANFLQKSQSLTQQGAAENPAQNVLGKAAGFAVGGNQGIGQNQQGFLTNPVTSMLLSSPGVKAGASAVAEMAPSAMREAAGGTLNTLRQTAGKIPVDTGQFGDSALELMTQDARGATLPTPVRKLINRLTMPGKPPLTYEEAKDFQSNISNLLANPVGEEGARLKNANTYRLVTKLNEGLKDSLESASQVAGADPGTFSGAMRGYAEASSRQDMIDRIHELSTKGIKIGAGGVVGGAAAGLGYDIFKIIKESVAGKQ